MRLCARATHRTGTREGSEDGDSLSPGGECGPNGSATQGNGWRMQQLLDNGVSELLDGGALDRGEGSETRPHAAVFGSADRLRVSANGGDLGRGCAQAKLGLKGTRGVTRLRVCMVDHLTPGGRIHRTFRGEVIKIEHLHPRQRADGWINVTRDGNIYQQQRAAGTQKERTGHGRGSDNRLSGRRGADKHVHLSQRRGEQFQRGRADARGRKGDTQGGKAAAGTVQQSGVRNTGNEQSAQRFLPGDTRTEHGGALALKARQGGRCTLHRKLSDGRVPVEDPSAPNPAGGPDCLAEQHVQLSAEGWVLAPCRLPGSADLAKHLAFTNRERIQPGGHTDKVVRGVRTRPDVEMWRKLHRGKPAPLRQQPGEYTGGAAAPGPAIDFQPVAGGENDAGANLLAHSGADGLGGALAPLCKQALSERDGSEMVGHANHE